MLLNTSKLCSAALVSFFACEAAARALELKPLVRPSAALRSRSSKRDTPEPITLHPVPAPDVPAHGNSPKREEPGNECFDPSSQSNFFWGADAGNTAYIANFTLYHPGDDEFILPVENFAKRLKSIKCGSQSDPYMKLEFQDKDSFSYAQSAWEWVNKADINRFTVVTEPNQCYDGDNRSPYLVKDIQFDTTKLTASLHAEEKRWAEVAEQFHLHLSHEYVNPDTANVTHPYLKRADKVMDIGHSFNQNLFSYSKESDETAGLSLSADAEISTGGQIIADFDIEKKLGFIPTDVKINIHPQGVHGDFLLKLNAEGKLGKGLDYTLKPEIEIPVAALNIKDILEVGPFVTMGVHLGATGIEGTAQVTTGARATIDDSATVNVKLRDPDENDISGWTPHFERIEPQFSATIGGSVRAWAELGVEIKVEVLGSWGYQAGIDAQLPYFEANFNAQANSQGVCGTQKTIGVGLDANVGININLNAGKVDEAPSFKKDLFQTSWALFSTCIAIGADNVATPTPTLEPTPGSSGVPTTTGQEPASTGPVETSPVSSAAEESSVVSSVLTPGPTPEPSDVPTATGENPLSTGPVKTNAVSSTVGGSPAAVSTSSLTPTPADVPTTTGENPVSTGPAETNAAPSTVEGSPVTPSTSTTEPTPEPHDGPTTTGENPVYTGPSETDAVPSTVEGSPITTSTPTSEPTPEPYGEPTSAGNPPVYAGPIESDPVSSAAPYYGGIAGTSTSSAKRSSKPCSTKPVATATTRTSTSSVKHSSKPCTSTSSVKPTSKPCTSTLVTTTRLPTTPYY